jgi:hypothetical protein
MHYTLFRVNFFLINLFSIWLLNGAFQLQKKDDFERIPKGLPWIFEGTISEMSWRE